MASWSIMFLWLHFAVFAAAVVLLAVPRWRRWLLSQSWSNIFLIVAAAGAIYAVVFGVLERA